MKIACNGTEIGFGSADDAVACLHRWATVDPLELWVSTAGEGPRMALLKRAGNAFLMYQRDADDAGVTSSSPTPRAGMLHYVLGNGQEDMYPAAWSIPVGACVAAIERFIRSGGARPDGVVWTNDAGMDGE